jgi:uncharacterized membrane protein
MNKILLPLILVIFLWSLMFIFYKKISGLTDYYTLVILKIIFLSIFGLICSTIYLILDKEKRKAIMNTDNKIINLIAIASLIELVTTFFYIYLLYKKDANWIIAILESGIIVTVALLSIMLLNEKISLDRILGIIIVLVGIVIVYKS